MPEGPIIGSITFRKALYIYYCYTFITGKGEDAQEGRTEGIYQACRTRIYLLYGLTIQQ